MRIIHPDVENLADVEQEQFDRLYKARGWEIYIAPEPEPDPETSTPDAPVEDDKPHRKARHTPGQQATTTSTEET
jgi:hypothetical protein